MPHLFSKRFHYGIADTEKFGRAVDMLVEAVPLATDYYCADSLIAYGRNLSFMANDEFVESINREKPSGAEASIMWRTHVVTWAASQCLRLKGDFVEAGVYRGFTARVVCNHLKFGALDRTYWLYDLFAPNPEQEIQFEDMGDTLYESVVRRFADLANVRIVRGAVPDSFAQGVPERVAFLHIDMNSVAGEIGALEALFDRMPSGGIILLDDYGWGAFRKQQRAEEAWFAARGRQVLELPTGQGMVIR